VTLTDFAEFFAARRDAVFRAVLVAVGDRAGAEDAVAEAFARAYQRWPSVRAHPNPTAWVIVVALNVSRSWWRRRRREVLTAIDREPPAVERLDSHDDAVADAMATLPHRQREVVALRVLADLSADETARLLGIAPATVHVHLHRALDALRRRLAANRTESAR
jgi:RNA polymerase sigma-70 factor (ECF subfamily)